MNITKQFPKIFGLLELAGFLAVALILKELMDPLFWRYSGPVSLITTIALIAIYIRTRGESWSSMGLRALPGLKAKLLVIPKAALIFVTVFATMVLLTKGLDAIGITFLSEIPEGETERWGDIEGNLQQYLILLALSWVSAGFCEEMFFRGFVLTKLMAVLGENKFALIISVILSATFFGYVHLYYQGLAGFVNAGVIGLIFATYYFAFKRSLWPLIVAHGFINSLGFTTEYLGLPG